MFQNGQTYSKNVAAFAARFVSAVPGHFGTLCIKSWILKQKSLNPKLKNLKQLSIIFENFRYMQRHHNFRYIHNNYIITT